MREFQSATPGRLRVLSVGAKILYSAFVIATVVGLLVSWRLYGAGIGDAGAGVYYAGQAPAPTSAATTAPSAPAGDAPVIALAPEDLKPREIVTQIPERKLLEVTHFHLFSMPVYVLILAHLWLLAKIPSWLQTGGVAAAVVTTGFHIAAPWIVRGRGGAGLIVGGSGALMLVVLGVMGIWSMIDMWLPNPRAAAAEELRKKRASTDPGSPA